MLRWCISVVCVLGCVGAQRGAYEVLVEPQAELQLPALPYSYEDLSPHLDSATLRVHHQGHHRAYTDKTNAALQEWREEDPAADSLARKSIVEILQRLPEVPGQWRTRLRNNGGGYLNHVFYWETMCPAPEGEGPMGVLAEDIAKAFGSVDDFKSAFSSAASGLFGSGYVWLCESSQGELSIVSTQNQDSPLTSGLYPLMVLDVWEHSYYLKHQNKRADYISCWWKVVCWEYVEQIRHFWQDFRTIPTHQEL